MQPKIRITCLVIDFHLYYSRYRNYLAKPHALTYWLRMKSSIHYRQIAASNWLWYVIAIRQNSKKTTCYYYCCYSVLGVVVFFFSAKMFWLNFMSLPHTIQREYILQYKWNLKFLINSEIEFRTFSIHVKSHIVWNLFYFYCIMT